MDNQKSNLKSACSSTVQSKWPSFKILDSDGSKLADTDFIFECDEGHILLLCKQRKELTSSPVSLGWNLDELEQHLLERLLRAFKHKKKISLMLYRSRRVFDKKDKSRVIDTKIFVSDDEVKLDWENLFPNSPLPEEAAWVVDGETVKEKGNMLLVEHRLKQGKETQIHHYELALADISNAIYESTLKYKTFPFNIPHSHHIIENGVERYSRGLEEWDDHLEQKGLLEDSNVEHKSCVDCSKKFYDTSDQVHCFYCYKKVQKSAKAEAMDLIKKAEQLCQSDDWKETAQQFKALQAQWQTIKALPSDERDQLWERFRKASQTFFDRQDKFFNDREQRLEGNKVKALELIKRAESCTKQENKREAKETIKSLQQEWKLVASLPRQDADKLWERFRSACQSVFAS